MAVLGHEAVPDGFVPCAHLYPAHPVRDGFNWHDVQAQHVGGEWKVTQGSMWMLSFGGNQSGAEHAAEIDLLERLAVDLVSGDLTDQHDHRC